MSGERGRKAVAWAQTLSARAWQSSLGGMAVLAGPAELCRGGKRRRLRNKGECNTFSARTARRRSLLTVWRGRTLSTSPEACKSGGEQGKGGRKWPGLTMAIGMVLAGALLASLCAPDGARLPVAIAEGAVGFLLRRRLVHAVAPMAESAMRRAFGAKETFRRKWKQALLQPIVAAFVGWVTNWLAVQMIFYPIEYFGLPLKRFVLGNVCGLDVLSPLGIVGWQGIVPAKAPKMAGTMVDVVTSRLLTVDEVFALVDAPTVATLLRPEVPPLAEKVSQRMLPESLVQFASAKVPKLQGEFVDRLATIRDDYMVGLVEMLKKRLNEALNLKDLVVHVRPRFSRLAGGINPDIACLGWGCRN